MKRTAYFLIIGIIAGLLTYYLGDKILIPYNSDGTLNIINIVIMGIFSNISAISIFSFIHIGINKLFDPDLENYTTAIRRGILLVLFLDFLAFLKIALLFNTTNLILSLAILALIETFFSTSNPPKE